MGTACYEPEKAAILWTIGFFPSGKEFSMRARFGFPSVKSGRTGRGCGCGCLRTGVDAVERKLAPISVRFEVPYYTASGIQVRYLKIVERTGYPALPWVRYITQNGDYLLRMPDSWSAN